MSRRSAVPGMSPKPRRGTIDVSVVSLAPNVPESRRRGWASAGRRCSVLPNCLLDRDVEADGRGDDQVGLQVGGTALNDRKRMRQHVAGRALDHSHVVEAGGPARQVQVECQRRGRYKVYVRGCPDRPVGTDEVTVVVRSNPAPLTVMVPVAALPWRVGVMPVRSTGLALAETS